MSPHGIKATAPSRDEGVSREQVRRWIEDARARAVKHGYPYRNPSTDKLERIARTISMLRRFYRWDHEAGRGSVHATKRPEIQKAIAVLLDALPAVRKEYEGGGLIDPEVGDLEFTAYDRLLSVVEETGAIIGISLKRKRGPQGDLLWHRWLKTLYHPIRVALADATGEEHPSPRDDGAMVSVICNALKEIDGKARQKATVGDALRKFLGESQTPRD